MVAEQQNKNAIVLLPITVLFYEFGEGRVFQDIVAV
jgi:hypothetical protein